MRTIFLALAPLALVAAAYSSPYEFASQAVREEVQSPDEWVPFTAVVRRLRPNKATDVVGRLYRASDGSRRLESGPPHNRQAVISINNFSHLKTYGFSSAYGWFQVALNPNVASPPKLVVDNMKSFRHAEKVEGFEVLRLVNDSGSVELVAPALNGEAVIRQHVDGDRQELTEIVIGEQPPELFEPPSGTTFKPAPPALLKMRGETSSSIARSPG